MGSWNSRTEPSAATGASARSLPPWLEMTRTPTKSGVDVTAPMFARTVVRTLPSVRGRLKSRNFVASAASVLGVGAPETHFKLPVVLAVPRSQW